MMRNKIGFSILLLCSGFIPSFLLAGSLKMENYSKVMVENLQIGQTYSMVDMVNLPLKVINGSADPGILAVDVVKPEARYVAKGFEVIPDASWVSVGTSRTALAAFDVYRSDVKIAIPDDIAYLGKKYQVNLRARMLPEGAYTAITLGINGHLLFTVAPVKAEGTAKVNYADLAYALRPDRIDLKDFPVGKLVEVLTDEGKPIILSNEGKKKNVYNLYSVDPVKADVRMEPKTEAIPDPNFLTFQDEELTVGSLESKPIRMYLEIPDKPEYRGKRYQLTVSARAGKTSDVTRYMRILVSTVK